MCSHQCTSQRRVDSSQPAEPVPIVPLEDSGSFELWGVWVGAVAVADVTYGLVGAMEDAVPENGDRATSIRMNAFTDIG